MLVRDKYQGDSVVKYFPDYSILKYVQHISGLKPYYRSIFTMRQAQRWNSINSYSNNWVFGTFCFCLIPVIFHKRIPVLKRFTSKLSRFLWGFMFLFIPSGIMSQYFSSKLEQQIQQSYQINAEDFMRYRLTGDITHMNDQVEFSDL